MGSSKSKPVEIDDEEAIKVIKYIDVLIGNGIPT